MPKTAARPMRRLRIRKLRIPSASSGERCKLQLLSSLLPLLSLFPPAPRRAAPCCAAQRTLKSSKPVPGHPARYAALFRPGRDFFPRLHGPNSFRTSVRRLAVLPLALEVFGHDGAPKVCSGTLVPGGPPQAIDVPLPSSAPRSSSLTPVPEPLAWRGRPTAAWPAHIKT